MCDGDIQRRMLEGSEYSM